MNPNWARRSARRGAAAVETALVFSLCLFPLLFAIMDYSWLFLQKSSIDTAAREGLRLGVTVSQTASPSPDDVAIAQARAVLDIYGLDGDAANITTAHVGSSPTETMTLTITIDPYAPLIGFPGIPLPTTLGTEANMLLELQN